MMKDLLRAVLNSDIQEGCADFERQYVSHKASHFLAHPAQQMDLLHVSLQPRARKLSSFFDTSFGMLNSDCAKKYKGGYRKVEDCVKDKNGVARTEQNCNESVKETKKGGQWTMCRWQKKQEKGTFTSAKEEGCHADGGTCDLPRCEACLAGMDVNEKTDGV
eukprot:gb/GFBE01003782.1/.p1 GENE.gb/GFBE01003782.1/~~gb/GFBE01003782.1/.p1  ORF type:complete len:162 (+),score=28.54 gb/GFBE01003782.1/:1-486(+)